MLGFIKLGAAVPKTIVADCAYNREQIIKCITKASKENVKILVFPELAICSYSCADLFYQKLLIDECEKNMCEIIEHSKGHDVIIAVGAPILSDYMLYNCAVIILNGKILGIVPKEILPEHGEYYEKRWFTSGSNYVGNTINYCGDNPPFGRLLFKCRNYEHLSFGAEICADFWSVIPPSSNYSLLGATVILNLSASPNYAGKPERRRNRVSFISGACMSAYIYTSSSVGESSSDVVFDGQAIIAEQGKIIAESERYAYDNVVITAEADLEDIVASRRKASDFTGRVDINVPTVEFEFKNRDDVCPDVVPGKNPFMPTSNTSDYFIDIINIQAAALRKRLEHTRMKKTIVGVSGGLDSALALLAAVNCADSMGLSRLNVIGISMPGFGTGGRTKSNALDLVKALGASYKEIPISESCLIHFKNIGHDPAVTDTTFENAQARERTQILMDIANMENGLVVGTGDMSELALGWCTYNGDHMSMYGVNSGIPKTVIKELISYIVETNKFGEAVSKTLADILMTPVSPELLPASNDGDMRQKTEELLGPYEVHDFFMYYIAYKCFTPQKTAFLAKQAFLGVYEESQIISWLKVFVKRFFMSQFKRSCMPDSPRIVELSLSQRADLRIPSDASGLHWIDDLDKE